MGDLSARGAVNSDGLPERRIFDDRHPRASPQPRSAIPPDDPQRTLAIVQSDGPQIRHISLVGDTYTILLTGDETGGRYCRAHVPPGRGPPPHRHDFEEMSPYT